MYETVLEFLRQKELRPPDAYGSRGLQCKNKTKQQKINNVSPYCWLGVIQCPEDAAERFEISVRSARSDTAARVYMLTEAAVYRPTQRGHGELPV